VLYLGDLAQAEQAAARLTALGHPRVEAENPYRAVPSQTWAPGFSSSMMT
jgi:hypothetical protein